jgi:uncharacterized MAPEG superfamily protein
MYIYITTFSLLSLSRTLVHEDILLPVVSVSALTLLIKYILLLKFTVPDSLKNMAFADIMRTTFHLCYVARTVSLRSILWRLISFISTVKSRRRKNYDNFFLSVIMYHNTCIHGQYIFFIILNALWFLCLFCLLARTVSLRSILWRLISFISTVKFEKVIFSVI